VPHLYDADFSVLPRLPDSCVPALATYILVCSPYQTKHPVDIQFSFIPTSPCTLRRFDDESPSFCCLNEFVSVKIFAGAPQCRKGANIMSFTGGVNLFMRSLLVLTPLLSAAPMLAQTVDAPEVIIAQENAFWKSYVDGNTADLSKLLLPEFISVEEQIWSRDQVLAFVARFHEQCSLAHIKLLDPHVNFLSPDIATLVYRATENPTCGTHTMSGETNISTVWVRRDGRWQMHLHSEYAIPPK
jgi:hypothetical protein